MFKSYPFIKQVEAKNCGIACMQMILKYYKANISKVKLMDLSKTNKSGTSAYNIIETFKYFDFDAKGLKVDKVNNITLPCIAHVVIDNSYFHYIVIYEVRKDGYIIADPANKIYKIKKEDFDKIFNGVVIVMTPTKKIPEYFMEESKFKFIFSILKNYYKEIIKIFVFSIFITCTAIINSYYLQFLIDNIYSNRNYLLFLFILFLLLYLLNVITSYARSKLLSILNRCIDYDLTMITFKQIINLPYRYYSSRTVGDVASRMADLEEVRLMISKVAVTLFMDTILVFISVFVLYSISSKLLMIAVIALLFYILILILFRKFINSYIDSYLKKKAEVNSYIYESISSYETVKGLSIERNIINLFKEKYLKLSSIIYKLDSTYNRENLFKDLVGSLSFIVLIYVGVLEIANGNLTIGKLITFNSLVIYFLEPIKNVLALDNNIISAKNAIKRVVEIFYDEKSDGVINSKIKGNIEIKNLSFSYNNMDDVLSNVSLSVKAKEKVLIVGGSGNGKSTLLKLIKKYYVSKRDSLFIDGIDINDYKKVAIDSNITYVSQNENLYTDTLYNNITLKRNISESLFLKMVKVCNIDFATSNLGFNMLVEENGFNLSGGQRQRVVLARALLNRFNVLLLDEATSEIDHNLERKILKNMFSVFNNKTIIMVSHRRENMDLFDKVLVVNKNNIEVMLKYG
ncbi:MAG: peptidase domain-containing ABC transporter [Bacilli bacterium]|nr:peptidase domain-containing ABC transporter [Bacilli bacterium]